MSSPTVLQDALWRAQRLRHHLELRKQFDLVMSPLAEQSLLNILPAIEALLSDELETSKDRPLEEWAVQEDRPIDRLAAGIIWSHV